MAWIGSTIEKSIVIQVLIGLIDIGRYDTISLRLYSAIRRFKADPAMPCRLVALLLRSLQSSKEDWLIEQAAAGKDQQAVALSLLSTTVVACRSLCNAT